MPTRNVRDDSDNVDVIAEARRQKALLKTGALQNAILTSADFSIIATDEKGIIQLFNPGAERMLGYAAAEVVNKLNPSDIHDPQEVAARARALSLELATSITPGFDALAFKASRGIEDVYELTFIRKDGSRFPAIVSITALREDTTTAHIPVVALSGNAIPRDIRKGLEAGFFRYLTKPINVNEFMKTADETLKFSKAEADHANPRVDRTEAI